MQHLLRHRLERATALLALVALAATGCGGGGSAPDRTGSTTVLVPGDGTGQTPAPPLPVASQLRRTLGSLTTGRYAHTATLLVNGQVLVAGGTVAGTTLSDRAELYAPSTDGFTATTGRMVVARSGHSATRLLDGRVLLVGGWVESPVGLLSTLASAEIYDPVTRTFREVGPLTSPRVDHAAALLADGRVLVTGGSVLQGSFLADLDDAEVFDPVSETFDALPARMAHTHATHALLNVGFGRFLVAGGSDADFRCEVFDSATERFTALAAPVGDGPRYNACAATFASGGSALCGGSDTLSVLYITPGGLTAVNSGSPLTFGRAFASATRISDGVLLVVGGVDFSNNGLLLASCDLVMETTGASSRTFATSLRFPTGMAAHTATRLLDGRVLYCGGLGTDAQQSGLRNAYVFSP